ncbi:MAG: protein-L-isoaspartate(D-aspartate) O-methyltransferase [Bacteroidota bacterium]
MLSDTFKHKGLRKKLVDEIQLKGIHNKQVLEAIAKIPRHYFLDAAFEEIAYQDKAFPIGAGQTISQPFTVAFQTQLLNVQKGDKILEIGTGSGYQATVLLEMGAKVYSIERQKSLYLKTKQFLSEINYFPKLFFGDGYKGLPTYAPFDKIIVTAGAPSVPEALLVQLKIGGVLLIPLGEEVQTMTTYTRKSENEFISATHGEFRFVPMLGDRME